MRQPVVAAQFPRRTSKADEIRAFGSGTIRKSLILAAFRTMSTRREWCRSKRERLAFSRNCPQLQIRAVERR